MYILDIVSLDQLDAQFNPTELEEDLKVDWARLDPPGFSHKPLQYVGTDNLQFSFDLLFDAMADGTSVEDIMRAHRFLKSVCYPKRGATNVKEGQAPRLLFVWPGFISLTSIITDLKFKFDRFNRAGTPTRFTVKVKIEEIRDTRLYGEDVRDEDTRGTPTVLA